MADVEAVASTVWQQARTERRSEQPLQIMHKQVSLDSLTDQQLEVLDRFCQWLIDAKAP